MSATALTGLAKNLIRFEAEAIAVKTNPKAKKTDAESIFGNKFTKSDLIELLVSNSTDQFGFATLSSEPPAVAVIFDMVSENVEQESLMDTISRLSERDSSLAEMRKNPKK